MKDTELALLNARKEFDGLLELIETAIWQGQELHKVEGHLFRALLRLGWHLLCYFLARKGLGDCGTTLLHDGQILVRGEVEGVPTGRSLGT